MNTPQKQSPQVAALDQELDAERAELARHEKIIGEAGAKRDAAAAATRKAADAYAAAPSPALLAAHRAAKEAERAAAAHVEQVTRASDPIRVRVGEIEGRRRDLLAAEAAAAARVRNDAAAAAERERRIKATLADRAHLEGLATRLGRPAFMASIAPSVARIVAARRELEAALVDVRAAVDEQARDSAAALTLVTEIGEPAPPAPPAPVGAAGEQIALVLVKRALIGAYQDQTPADLNWFEVAPFAADSFEFARWAFHVLGRLEFKRRTNVTDAASVDLLLEHGRDVGAEIEAEQGALVEARRLAGQTDERADPVFRARHAIRELSHVLAVGDRLGREAQLVTWILDGGRALARWLAAQQGFVEPYQCDGEQGRIAIPPGTDFQHARVDKIGKALGISDDAAGAAVRLRLGIPKGKTLLDVIGPIEAEASSAVALHLPEEAARIPA